MKQSSAMKAGFRSTFELNLARALSERGVDYEHESMKLTYVPAAHVHAGLLHPRDGHHVEEGASRQG